MNGIWVWTCMFPPLREGPRDARTDAHAYGGTFVPRKATISWFATNPTRTFFANASKADRNHGFMLCGRSVRMRSCSQFSFYDRQNSHFMTDEFHFMTHKFHFMTEPTQQSHRPSLVERCLSYFCLNALTTA